MASSSSNPNPSSSKDEWLYDLSLPFIDNDEASSSSEKEWLYDVFLTFHTKCLAINSLQISLRDAPIKTFIDEDGEMTPNLLKTIERSRIVIIVFTKHFVYCGRCLFKQNKIMKTCNKVCRVFCDVSPSYINWLDSTEESLMDPEDDLLVEEFLWKTSFNSFKTKLINSWKRWFAESTSLFDWTLSRNCSRDNRMIEKITHTIRIELDTMDLEIPRHLVGIQLQVKEVLRLFKYYSSDIVVREENVIVVGIRGVGGIGKTTIAKIIYDTISDKFESKCFLSSIRNVWDKDDGPFCLQEQLTSNISGTQHEKIDDAEMGIRPINIVLRDKKALVVLDDVSQIEQLMALCGSREWFGFGSVILITTRHKHILDYLQVKYVYEVKRMNESDSLEVFSWNAFKQPRPEDRLTNLAKKVVTYCEGLPLVLEVIGSLLFHTTNLEWKSVLKKLKSIPRGQIQKKLKISCEYLDDSAKDLFCNIACFYVGEEKHVVMKELSGFQYSVESSIMLIERSLVKVDMKNKLEMHDLLLDIGKEMNPNKPKPKCFFDVFLSFRGEDTRKSLANNLFVALRKAGIEVFMDKEIRRGENIPSSLMQAIECSKMSIIIFSINYADSSWCLQELVKILECHRTIGQKVLPIFYGVPPSDVRKQTGDFGKNFESLITRISASEDKQLSWMRALNKAAHLSGCNSLHYGTDAELIDDIIEEVTMKLDDNTYLFVAHHPVGVKSRVQEIVEFLSEKSNEIMVVGIYGMGGIGKTTIAKAIYNKIGKRFDSKSFLSNIREAWEHVNGPIHLQEQLLSDILQRRMALHNVELGKAIMKKRFCHKRTLIILDDVTNAVQLNALYGSREWFGQGSTIIITTRDEHVLKLLQADIEYNMKEMNHEESLELFSWHAFKQSSPIDDFNELSKKIITYSERLPLALEILGSYLLDRPKEAWKSVLDRLKELPNDQIHEKLRISYEGLSNDAEKDIFLDICCFFIGRDRNYTTQILDGCGLHAEIGITRLIELCLVRVDKNNKLDMHSLLRDMGREIIREMSPEKPEKRTRLWVHNDVIEVLSHHLGTRTIKGLTLNSSRRNTLSFDTTTFKMMTRLRLLQLGHVKLDGNYKYLSKELRWLCWHGFPMSYIPDNFYQQNMIAINLKYSYLTQVWEKCQLLERLKFLNLSHSYYLSQTPDFSKLPNLERLVLKDCPRLSFIHPSVGDLKHLILVNLKNCKNLSDLPRSLYNLKSLKTLNLYGCSKIDKLEEGFEQMESLTTLLANETAITEVPHSLVRSRSIKYVSLCGYEGLPYGLFSSVVWSWTSPTNNRRFLRQAFASTPSLLQHLFHRSSNQTCGNMKTRQTTSNISCTQLPGLIGFHDQIHTTRAENFTSSLIIQVGGLNKVIDMLLKSISQEWNDGGLHNSFPKDNYPDWLVFGNKGSSVSFKVPRVTNRCLKGIVLKIIYSSLQESIASVYPIGLVITNFTKGTMEWYKRDATTSADYEWQKIIFDLESMHEVKVEVMFAHKYIVKKTTIYLVYVEETNKLSITV